MKFNTNVIKTWSIHVLLLMILVMAGSALPNEKANDYQPFVTPPIRLTEPSRQELFRPTWIKKIPGHYSLTDWRRMIDSVWGPGLPVVEKLAIFDLFWEIIDDSFACFNNLFINWDSLRTAYRAEIEDTVSRGRFAAIMNHMGIALKEGHTNVRDFLVNDNTELLPGVPLWVIGAWWDVGHFGAGLTPLPDSSLLVYRVIENHPLGLERGDVVLGYDRRSWTEILHELEEAQLPVCRWWAWGSSNSSMEHSLLNGAGMNWHLFDTIDIVKYSTGDTVHLPTSLLVGQNMHLLSTDQMDIPGVPMPDTSILQAVSYGIISGTQIGYIYVWRWWDNAEAEFYEAVNALVNNPALRGMIIDFRYNEGGNMFMSNTGLQLLFRDPVETVCMSVRNDPGNHFTLTVILPAYYYIIPGNGVGFDKPIAVLVGPGAISSGDQVAFRMTFHPRVKTFGKSTCTAFNAPTVSNLHPDWYFRYAPYEACLASDTLYYLTHREFPVDVPVWLTREDVVRGEDAVVKEAIAWIDSTAGMAEESELRVEKLQPTPTVIHGVLNLQSSISNLQSEITLLDLTGRKVADLKSSANNIRHLAPGIYFIRSKNNNQVTKIVVTR